MGPDGRKRDPQMDVKNRPRGGSQKASKIDPNGLPHIDSKVETTVPKLTTKWTREGTPRRDPKMVRNGPPGGTLKITKMDPQRGRDGPPEKEPALEALSKNDPWGVPKTDPKMRPLWEPKLLKTGSRKASQKGGQNGPKMDSPRAPKADPQGTPR